MSTNNDIRARQVERLQENLSTLRKLAAWTAEELGDKIGVTKQTISNWENYKPNDSSLKKSGAKMGLVHYIAIRHVLDYEIENFENKEQADLISNAIAILIDSNEEKISEEDYAEAKETIKSIAQVAAGGAVGIAASMFSKMGLALLAGAVGGAVAPTAIAAGAMGVGGVTGFTWLKKILREKKE